MATASTARPANPLRARRDGPRLSHVSTKRAATTDPNGDATSTKRRKLEEPYVRTQDFYLKKFAGKQPSLVVHLHQNYFKFDGQDGSFPLDSPMKFFLTHLRHRTVPHQMMEELFVNNVPFYDGCLIVEVHNHRQENGKDRARSESAAGDQVRYSMHNYTSYITPSPFAPYPKKAAEAEVSDKVEADAAESSEKSKTKGKGKEGPHIVTLVLEPTELSRHAEIEILARTPASEMRSSKRSADGTTPSGGQPQTPHLSMPPTPQIGTSRSPPGQEQKMCLEPEDLYQFQADVLLMTEPPLLLEPLNNHKALDVLAHPLHSAAPPSPKTRKRTTAEMAADDAQAAEAERRMLIMDERIKPSARSGVGTNTGDNAGAASTLGFSRFKTLTMVRERLEEQDRLKKDEEARAAAERKQQEEANAVQQQKAQAQQEQQRKLMNQRQQFARQQAQQQEMLRVNQQAVAAQQAALMAQHAAQNHPQQNGMMMNQQQFQHQQAMAQGSPVVRNQTPMVNNSSPMMQQNGFPMTATTSQQGINSPQRPASAAMPNGNLMARQVSQNQHASRNGTPQMQQGTPNMAGVVPNRQVSQTPRMPLASPGPGTPGAGNMQTPQQANMTPEQWAMLNAQRQQMASQGGAMHAGSPGQNMGQMSMTPEQIQNIRQQQAMRQQQMMAQAQASGQIQPNDPRHAAMLAQRQAMIAQQQHQQQMRQRMLAQQQQQQQQQGMPQQQQLNQGQAGSPQVNMQATPNMNQAQLQQNGNVADGANGQQQQQQLTPQQQQARAAQQMQFRSAQAQLQQLSAQYNGFQNIPQQVIAALPQAAQILLRNQYQRQQLARDQATRTQAMAMKAQQAQVAGQAVVGTSGGDPEYMATLRHHQFLLAQQAQQQQNGGGGGMVNGMPNGQASQQFGAVQGSGDQLAQSFAAAQHAFQQRNQQAQQQQQQGGGMQ